MLARVLSWGGGIGAGFAGLCCVTGLLPFLLGALGLGSLVSLLYRDSVLIPALGISLMLMGAGLWLRKNQSH
jgi:mercuric ion transport protein